MSSTSGSPGTPSRRRPSARGHSGGSPATPSRRRPYARGHSSGSPCTPSRRRAPAGGRNGGFAQESDSKMEEEAAVHAQEQIEKLKRVARVVARAREAAARVREAAARSMDKSAAYAEGAILGSLNESLLMPQSTRNTNATPVPPSTPTPAIGTGMANPPMPKEEDESWNKRHIMYLLVLTSTVGLVFLMQPLLSPVYGRLILLVVAAVWGVGIVGLPFALYGTSRCEKECSRHVGWLISTLFALLMIYCFYLVALRVNGTSAPAPSSSHLEGDQKSTDSSDDFWWTVAFGVVGSYVLAGYLWAWFRLDQ